MLSLGAGRSFLATVVSAAVLVSGLAFSPRSADSTCSSISSAISSSSSVYHFLSSHYTKDIEHYISSSSQLPACTVEPGTAADVSKIIKILASTKTPFAVKGGGHTGNPGFSSTSGVHISMTRFSGVTYDAASGTATIGTGLIWDDVYMALEPFGVNVVGGRVSGVGVAGFTLGGGYSFLSNQYGLTVDTVTAFELVLPDGTIAEVSSSSRPDLFFGLKGGFNNFGIVTKITLKTFPQGQVWGGSLTIVGTQKNIDAITAATVKFAAEITDPKAAIITTYNSITGLVTGIPEVSQLLFYDGPSPPAGIFDDFLAVSTLSKSIGTKSFLSLVTAAQANVTSGFRGLFHTVSTTSYPTAFVNAVVNETSHWGDRLALDSSFLISYDLEPFLPSAYAQGTAASSAYPPTRQPFNPTNIYYAWSFSAADDTMRTVALESAATLNALAQREGISAPTVYGNYAIAGTALAQIYGDHLPALQALKKTYDPQNVMGQAGGWKF